MNWDDPAARLALIEAVGVEEYNRRHAAHRESTVCQVVNGHKLRPVTSRFGTLFMVGDTGKAFASLDEAVAFAKDQPCV